MEQTEMPTTSSGNAMDKAAVQESFEESDTSDEIDDSDCEDDIVDSIRQLKMSSC